MNIKNFANSFFYRLKEKTIIFLFKLQLKRLKRERLTNKKRIMATACANFPIYSQTFVYQEMTQVVNQGYSLRFLFHRYDSKRFLPDQFIKLWHSRQKIMYHENLSKYNYNYYMKRMPGKVESLINSLCKASGKSANEIKSHQHFLQAFSFTRMVEAYAPFYLHSYFFYEGTFFTAIASYLLDISRGVSCYADHLLDDYELKIVPFHIGKCKIIVATSNRIKQELIQLAPAADPEKIIVKPNAVNVNSFPRINLKRHEKNKPYKLICVCRIDPKKGLIYLVEAVKILGQNNINVELHIIGGIEDSQININYAASLKNKIKEYKLEDTVFLEGRRTESEIKQFFSSSDIFVAPFVETESGDKDGIPTSLLEAMSSGLPVVASDAGSIPEVINNGHDGIIVPQQQANELAAAIKGLLNDYDKRIELGKNAGEKIRSEFDVSVCEHLFHAKLSNILKQ